MHKNYNLLAITGSNNLDQIPKELFNLEIETLDADDPKNFREVVKMRAVEAYLFQELAPGWVFVDCIIQPSSYLTVTGPADILDDEQLTDINKWLEEIKKSTFENPNILNVSKNIANLDELFDPITKDDSIIIAEYIANLSINSDTIVGYGLGSLTPGYGRFIKSCAYSFYKKLYNVKKQIGICQYYHQAVPTHTRFGPLKIINPLALHHSHPGETFIYECKIPSEYDLAIMRSDDFQHDPEKNIEKIQPDNVEIIKEENQLSELINHQLNKTRQYWVIDQERDSSSFTVCYKNL